MIKNDKTETINNRLNFVKSLLKNKELKPIVDYDNTNSDAYISYGKNKDDSCESYDTRTSLNKEIHDIRTIINELGGDLTYIKSGTTGHTFKGEQRDNNNNIIHNYAVKVVAYSIKDKYGDVHDTERPENAELLMIKLLSYFVVTKKTPHIVLPIGTFDTNINTFMKLVEQKQLIDKNKTKKNEKYKEFVERYEKGEFYDEVSILISEWANNGDFNDFVKINNAKLTTLDWKIFFFQIISTLAIIQSKYPAFRHNDLKANNILITKTNNNKTTQRYRIKNGSSQDKYIVPSNGYQLKIWDFDFACIPDIVNNKKVSISNKWSRGINIAPVQNRYYDIHYFFNTFIRKGFFPDILTSDNIDQSVKKFILSIVPQKYQTGEYVAKGGRILHNIEYQIPAEILKHNPFFAEFRKNAENMIKSSSKNNINMNDFLSSSSLKQHNIIPTINSKNNKKTKKTSKSTKKNNNDLYSFDIDKLLLDL